MRIRIALAAGLALLAGALAVTLLRAPLTVGRTNLNAPESVQARLAKITSTTARVCQRDELVPGGTSALHLSVRTDTLGPALSVSVLSGSRVVSRGSRDAGWRGPGVSIPIGHVAGTLAHATVCLTTGRLYEQLGIRGEKTARALAATSNGRPIAGRMKIEYLRRGENSWLSMARAVARRMGLGQTPGGSWAALLLAAAMLAVAALTSWLLLRELAGSRTADGARRRWWRPPGAATACMAIAFLNAASWSLITPPFQVDDEEAHFAYVQQLAERAALPFQNLNSPFSAEEEVALHYVRFNTLRLDSRTHAVGSLAEHRRLEAELGARPSRVGSGNAGVAASEPPLYYALETIPYALGSGGTILVRIELMRILSALMAAATALFVFLFLREALPGTRWAWTVGGLVAALAPLVAVISGSVNPDALLCAVSAACLYCLARGFARGLTARLAFALGAVTAVGLVSKLNFVGLAPGAMLGLLILARRARPTAGPLAYRWLALGVSVALSPVAAYALIAAVSDPGGLHRLWEVIPRPFPHGSKLGELSYLWQSYLPRLPGMSARFPGVLVWREVWFNELLGYYGWDDIYFADWVEKLALIPAVAVFALSIRSLLQRRSRVRARLAELGVYAVIALGVLAMVALASYQVYPEAALEYRMARYLLPLLALGCAVVVLGARALGRRWGPVAGTLIVVLVLAHDVFSQLLVIARYYG